MINLQPVLDARLWASVEKSYQAGDYTTAIIDSIHFLGELIRDRSGLQADGLVLIGEAFGGTNPKLKVNSLQTESDRNLQKGIEQLLRGIYQGIRNPRSHEKHSDSLEDSEAVILFINYLVRIIGRTRSPFDKDSYLNRVFDPSFTEDDRYAELLIAEIPVRKRWDILMDVFTMKEERGLPDKLRFFMTALLKTLSNAEVMSFCEIVSDQLKVTDSDRTITTIFRIVPFEYWPHYSEIARIRVEGKLIDSIKDGRYDRKRGRCLAGHLGSWAAGLEAKFVLQEKLVSTLTSKLASSSIEQQDYFFRYFSLRRVREIINAPSPWLRNTLKGQLKAGDVRFHQELAFLSNLEQTDPWSVDLRDSYNAFSAAPDLVTEVSDDDVPF